MVRFVSIETREKIAASKRGKPRDAETRRKLSIANTGKKMPEETKRKISNSLKGEKSPFFGKTKPREQIEKMRLKLIGRSPPNKGIPLTDEQRKHLSEIQKGKKLSQSHIENIRKATIGKNNPFFGKTHSREAREKISFAKLNLSDDARNNMSLSHIGKMCGEKHPNWKGGISFEPYCQKFNADFKRRVRLFFDNTCLMCGEKSFVRKLDVHHVTANKKSCCDDTVPLFVTLCKQCHGKVQCDKSYWESYFTNLIYSYYGGKCYLSKLEELHVLSIGGV